MRLLKTFLPYSVVSLSPDTALCALSHNSSVVCLSYIALCFSHRQPAGGGPPSPTASTPRRGYVRYRGYDHRQIRVYYRLAVCKCRKNFVLLRELKTPSPVSRGPPSPPASTPQRGYKWVCFCPCLCALGASDRRASPGICPSGSSSDSPREPDWAGRASPASRRSSGCGRDPGFPAATLAFLEWPWVCF